MEATYHMMAVLGFAAVVVAVFWTGAWIAKLYRDFRWTESRADRVSVDLRNAENRICDLERRVYAIEEGAANDRG